MLDKPKVFISHAVEDQVGIVNKLVKELTKNDIDVWHSGEDLLVGDGIAESINKGIRRSDFGIVVMSPKYLQAIWARMELEALFALESTQKIKILPVFHKISPEEVIDQYPLLAGRFGISTKQKLETLAGKLENIIRMGRRPAPNPITTTRSKLPFMMMAVVTLLMAINTIYNIDHLKAEGPVSNTENLLNAIPGTFDLCSYQVKWLWNPTMRQHLRPQELKDLLPTIEVLEFVSDSTVKITSTYKIEIGIEEKYWHCNHKRDSLNKASKKTKVHQPNTLMSIFGKTVDD
ncbi:toll/interleukin-1 receptor domain-containing protein [Fulvivirgaceae bacterium BMA10]|uniref:Toll/interleukin-1 receptor domain-containing protein n=1 Tax=Splendidivirga corallicola TaxID=3051826 RepID=A0ABT8KZ45_9BACT|nr:toll/interleukin-1 receptor domain-containing protein [Fulvivirgaceae bacterium BMA10]